MKKKTLRIAGVGIAVAATVLIGTGFAGAQIPMPGDDDTDAPLTGSTLERASTAALARTGGGVITETETGDDGAAYGVEIRRPDGRQVEVELDQDFTVVGEAVDDDGPGDSNSDAD